MLFIWRLWSHCATKSVPPHNPKSCHRPQAQLPLCFLIYRNARKKKKKTKKHFFFLSADVAACLRLTQYFNISYICTDWNLSFLLMSCYFITGFLEWKIRCLLPDKPDFFFTYLLRGPECYCRCRQTVIRDATPSSRIQTITHFQRGCTGCIFLLPLSHRTLPLFWP